MFSKIADNFNLMNIKHKGRDSEHMMQQYMIFTQFYCLASVGFDFLFSDNRSHFGHFRIKPIIQGLWKHELHALHL
jgi:hypothetical protein